MKKLFVIACVAVGLSGCAQFDQFALDEVETTEVVEGEVEVPVVTTNVVERIQESGAIVQDTVVSTNYVKQPYRIEIPVIQYKPSANIEAAGNAAGLFGPWGTFAGAVLTGVLGIYARNKNRFAKQKALEAEGLAKEKGRIEKAAKAVINNVSDAIELLEDLDKSSEGTLVKDYIGRIKRKQEELNVRGVVDAIRKGIS